MIDQNGFVGIDVAKTHFDIHLHPSDMRWRSSTHAIEIDTLVQRLLALDPVAVGLEASGGYEQTLADRLHAAGLKVYLLPPARVRSFAQGIGLLAKTDRIDAAVIAHYLGVVHERLTPYKPDPARQRLHAITAHRRRLVAEKTGLLSQLDTIAEPIVRGLIEARMVGIAGEIKTLEAAIADLLAQTPPLCQRQARLRQVTGVGPVLAISLLADMPELGKVSAKAAAALIGVAPYSRQSGRTDRNGRCLGAASICATLPTWPSSAPSRPRIPSSQASTNASEPGENPSSSP